jgi:TolA-binding protein
MQPFRSDYWRPSRLKAAAAFMLLASLSFAPFAMAQEPPPQPVQGQAPAAAPQGGDRIGRLEAQIGELQAMVAALQSLVKQSPDARLPQESEAAAAMPASGAADPGVTSRLDVLETQMGAITSQLDMMTQQLGALQGRLNSGGDAGGGGGGVADPNAPQPLAPVPGQPQQPLPGEGYGRQGMAPASPEGARVASAGQGEQFTSSIFTRDEAPSPPGMPEDAPVPLSASDNPPGTRMAALPSGGDAVSLYNEAYSDLQRSDYASAEIGFRKLLARFPADPLAGNAQYWLGES